MKSVPGTLFFKPMNPQPTIENTPAGPYAHFDRVLWGSKDVVGCLVSELHKYAPFRPGEKCYVWEAYKLWFPCDDNGDPIDDHWHVRYKEGAERIMDTGWDEGPHYLTPHDVGLDKEPDAWRSPVTMPQWATRHFVTIVSCEPMKISEVTVADAETVGVVAAWDSLHVNQQEHLKEKYRRDAIGEDDLFYLLWHKRHPSKEWAWRVEGKEERDA